MNRIYKINIVFIVFIVTSVFFVAAAVALFIAAAVALSACVPPMAPSNDASDANVVATVDAATPPVDAAPAVVEASSDVCAAACAALAAAGCSEGTKASCLTTLQKLDALPIKAEPSGRPLSCADLAGVKTAGDAIRLGVDCASSSPSALPRLLPNPYRK